MGVGTINCARHDMKPLNGIGDLQKGEYINMDYIVCSALLALAMTMINISYDIACHESSLIQFFVLKFHIQAHIKKCWMNFSFNWSRHCDWSNINRVASSMKEMGPGMRRDTLDDHFGDWNWKKVTVHQVGERAF
ncbi:hypothetical protein F4604DRAFT_1885305 [Suillus subluteus]|nr:hypothetical protein F4604DRAFT_1885305 [Suillus subluteus]